MNSMLLMVCVPVNVLLLANCGTLVVSRFKVTLPEEPPPLRSVPAVTPVIVPLPVPGNICPTAKVTRPLLAM